MQGAAWPLALATATIVGSLAAACMTPFVALSVLAVATMPLRRAVLTIGCIWAANQALGFTVLGYPGTSYAVVWGVALGLASLAAGLVARIVLRGQRDLAVVPLLLSLGAAFVAFEGLLFGFALVAGGIETFAPTIVTQILLNDALWLAGLSALYVVLARTAPNWFGPAPALRIA